MYGEGWIFKGGKGGLSGGGGANGEWVWEEIPVPIDDYTLECDDDDIPYLGMIIEEEIISGDYYFEILMQRSCVPSIGYFNTLGSPLRVDYTEQSTGDSEVEDYDNLPVPEGCFDSGELISYSALTASGLKSLEWEFDGAIYYAPYICDGIQNYVNDAVLATRGQTYIDNLSGNYPGTSRVWEYKYQRTRVEETDFPGVIIPHGGGILSPGAAAGIGTILDFFNQPSIEGPRIKRS